VRFSVFLINIRRKIFKNILHFNGTIILHTLSKKGVDTSSKEWCLRMQTGFTWLRIETSDHGNAVSATTDGRDFLGELRDE
jgi:hypothetical protein